MRQRSTGGGPSGPTPIARCRCGSRARYASVLWALGERAGPRLRHTAEGCPPWHRAAGNLDGGHRVWPAGEERGQQRATRTRRVEHVASSYVVGRDPVGDVGGGQRRPRLPVPGRGHQTQPGASCHLHPVNGRPIARASPGKERPGDPRRKALRVAGLVPDREPDQRGAARRSIEPVAVATPAERHRRLR